jgi:hypothetical protein
MSLKLSFPGAIRQFDQPVIDAVTRRLKTQGLTQDFHGLTCAAEGACHKIRLRELGEKGAESLAIPAGLSAAAGIERNITLALVAALGVPIGFAVSNKEKFKAGPHRIAGSLAKLNLK